jgi:hypothetical protein
MSSLYDTLLTRRELLKVGACSVAGYWFLPLLEPSNVQAQARVQPRNSARFVIFVNLDGGQSHVDAWDLKEHTWTPQNFEIKEIQPGVKWPTSIYPNLAKHWGKFSLVRSLEAWDSVHLRAQYTVQSAHLFNPALQKELPPLGSVIAYEYASKRRASDTLPGYVAVNMTSPQVGLLKSGFLPATYTPFHVDTTVGPETLSMDDAGRREFMRRWELLKTFDERLRNDPSLAAKAYRDYNDHYEGAVSMMSDSRASQIFAIDPADHQRYGTSLIGDGLIVARNLVAADAGTHFVIVNQTFWDHHGRIYGENNHYRMSRDLDAGLANLLEDLSTRKRADGKSLLDETLVVCFGEFGRTPGELNPGQGRDHYQYAFTGLFAGGGVQGGRIVGRTDELGAKIVDPGWPLKRSVYMEDVATTIYSAMGFDWTKKIDDTPSGRAFHYIEPFAARQFIRSQEITPLFA